MYLFSHKNLQYCICKAKIAKNSMVLVQFRPDPMTLSLSGEPQMMRRSGKVISWSSEGVRKGHNPFPFILNSLSHLFGSFYDSSDAGVAVTHFHFARGAQPTCGMAWGLSSSSPLLSKTALRSGFHSNSTMFEALFVEFVELA